jgi:hypothetical protein
MTGYHKTLLRPGETVLHVGRLHWRLYLRAACLFLVGVALMGAGGASQVPPLIMVGFLLLLIAAVLGLSAWWRRVTTEIVVTDLRVIWKRTNRNYQHDDACHRGRKYTQSSPVGAPPVGAGNDSAIAEDACDLFTDRGSCCVAQ